MTIAVPTGSRVPEGNAGAKLLTLLPGTVSGAEELKRIRGSSNTVWVLQSEA